VLGSIHGELGELLGDEPLIRWVIHLVSIHYEHIEFAICSNLLQAML